MSAAVAVPGPFFFSTRTGSVRAPFRFRAAFRLCSSSFSVSGRFGLSLTTSASAIRSSAETSLSRYSESFKVRPPPYPPRNGGCAPVADLDGLRTEPVVLRYRSDCAPIEPAMASPAWSWKGVGLSQIPCSRLALRGPVPLREVPPMFVKTKRRISPRTRY